MGEDGGGGDPRSLVGQAGEAAALERYLAAGYRLVARNWRSPLGELDLVVARPPTLVVCEVKARRGHGHGGPFDAVTWDKQRRIRRLTEAFLAGRPDLEVTVGEIRFDVASVSFGPGGRPSVHVFEDAF